MPALKGRGGKFPFFKASPFDTPSAPPEASDDESDDNFFSRSEQTYAILAAEKEERKKRKADRAQDVDTGKGAGTPSDGKKSKTADFGDNYESARSDTDKHATLDDTPEMTGSILQEQLMVRDRDGADYEAGSSNGPLQASTPEVIDLEDELGDNPDTSPVEISGGARELGASQKSGPRPAVALEPTDEPLRSENEEVAGPGASNSTREEQTAAIVSNSGPKPTVLILITSMIPGTSSLKVQRRLDQRLKEARLEWCNRQGLDKEKTGEVILTWQGKLLYDSTSCEGLGISVNSSGELVHEGDADPTDYTDAHLHVEAMTRQMLKDRKDVKPKPSKVPGDSPSNEVSQPKEPTEARVRLILKSKDHEDVKLAVRESHNIRRLINVFRSVNEIDESDSISVHFDGEELDPDATVASYDIGDMDTLDVYMKS